MSYFYVAKLKKKENKISDLSIKNKRANRNVINKKYMIFQETRGERQVTIDFMMGYTKA